MKHAAIFIATVSLALLNTTAALSGHGHHARDTSLVATSHKHARLARRQHVPTNATTQFNTQALAGLNVYGRTVKHAKRKELGEGDSVSQPANLASGSFGADQGCTCWHTVMNGEVCLGLIDKSSSGFTIDQFHKFNPEVGQDCSNLVTGQAYCVDNGPNTEPAGSSPTPASPKDTSVPQATTTNSTAKPATTAKQLVSTNTSSDGTSDDEGDCGEDGDDSEDDGDEDCDSEDDGGDGLDAAVTASVAIQIAAKPTTTSTSSTSSSADVALPTANYGGSVQGKEADAQFTGIATWYTQNGNPGNCGKYLDDSDYIVALYTPQYGSGDHCWEQVMLTNVDTGATVVATVADSCPSCEQNGNIDTSVAVFAVLSGNNPGAGVENVKWAFL